MRFLPSFKCCIGKTGIELDLLSEISSIFTGLHSEIFKWIQMAATQQTQLLPGVFAFFDLAPLKRRLLHELPLSCIDSELLLQHPKLTMNRSLTFPWIEDCHQISLQESLETPWNTTLATWISSIWTTGGWDAEFASSIWKIGVISSIFESFSIVCWQSFRARCLDGFRDIGRDNFRFSTTSSQSPFYLGLQSRHL